MRTHALAEFAEQLGGPGRSPTLSPASSFCLHEPSRPAVVSDGDHLGHVGHVSHYTQHSRLPPATSTALHGMSHQQRAPRCTAWSTTPPTFSDCVLRGTFGHDGSRWTLDAAAAAAATMTCSCSSLTGLCCEDAVTFVARSSGRQGRTELGLSRRAVSEPRVGRPTALGRGSSASSNTIAAICAAAGGDVVLLLPRPDADALLDARAATAQSRPSRFLGTSRLVLQRLINDVHLVDHVVRRNRAPSASSRRTRRRSHRYRGHLPLFARAVSSSTISEKHNVVAAARPSRRMCATRAAKQQPQRRSHRFRGHPLGHGARPAAAPHISTSSGHRDPAMQQRRAAAASSSSPSPSVRQLILSLSRAKPRSRTISGHRDPAM